MRRPHRHNFLFRIACEGLRLLACVIAACVCICLFLIPFGATAQAEALFQATMPFFSRLSLALLSLLMIAGLLESLD
ncbi:MAG: hypothetical protein ACFBSG_14400 [Leptolyngbyaceae cyanobacterium]